MWVETAICVAQNPKLAEAIQNPRLGPPQFVGAFLVKESVEGAGAHGAASASGGMAGSASEGQLGGGSGVVAGSIWKGPEGAMHEWDPAGAAGATGAGEGADPGPESPSDPREQLLQLSGKKLYNGMHHFGTLAQVRFSPPRAPAAAAECLHHSWYKLCMSLYHEMTSWNHYYDILHPSPRLHRPAECSEASWESLCSEPGLRKHAGANAPLSPCPVSFLTQRKVLTCLCCVEWPVQIIQVFRGGDGKAVQLLLQGHRRLKATGVVRRWARQLAMPCCEQCRGAAAPYKSWLLGADNGMGPSWRLHGLSDAVAQYGGSGGLQVPVAILHCAGLSQAELSHAVT